MDRKLEKELNTNEETESTKKRAKEREDPTNEQDKIEVDSHKSARGRIRIDKRKSRVARKELIVTHYRSFYIAEYR